MKLKIKEKHYYFLVTCNHCVKEENINLKNDIIVHYKGFDDKNVKKKIKLNREIRFIKTYEKKDKIKGNNIIVNSEEIKYDVTLIKLFEFDKIGNLKYY